MRFKPSTFFRRRSSVFRKCIYLLCALSIGWLTLFATSHFKLPDPGNAEREVLSSAWRINNIKDALDHDTDNDKQSITYYDGSFIRGTRSEALEDLVQLEISSIVPGLGDGGIAVYNDVDQDKLEEILKKEAFNLLLSNKIAYTRKLADLRNLECHSLTFQTNLPTASVVIIFTNEAWSSLLRTVYSVLNRTPPHLLKEIILVDDNSTRECLGKTLEYYIATRLPDLVRLIRLEKRSGLIQARLAGAKHATGDVLVFLDAHCEATFMWLEPMLQRIQEVPNAAVVPLIDVIDDKTFEYKFSRSLDGVQVGGFTWSGHYKWFTPEHHNRTRLTDPIRSPTMAGGLFAIGRKYFWEVGSYDSQMEVWGGENLEMSFRIWQCGGRLESIPCSRVGHIFRDFHPYSFPGGADTHGINTARLAEVWLDKYKELLYLHRHDLKIASIGDITERKQLREKLNCKNFRWFLDNVYPEKFILNEDVEVSGRVFIKNELKKYCIDTMQREKDVTPYKPGTYSCHPTISMSQYFSLTNKGVLRREDVCAEVVDINDGIGYVKMVECRRNQNQQWVRLSTGQLQHSSSKLCIDGVESESQTYLVAKTCDDNVKTQIWIWDDKLEW